MLELPVVVHDLLSERLDEYLSGLAGAPDPALVATAVVGTVEGVAEELADDLDPELVESLVSRLEGSGELDASLAEVLEEAFESDEDFEYVADDVVALLERLCELEWTSADDEPVGFGASAALAMAEDEL